MAMDSFSVLMLEPFLPLALMSSSLFCWLCGHVFVRMCGFVYAQVGGWVPWGRYAHRSRGIEGGGRGQKAY